MSLKDAQVREIMRVLTPHRPLAVYVFGSAASGSQRPGSDLDLAVLFGEPLPAVERYELQNALAEGLGVDIDLVDLKQASTVLRKEVLARGERLYDSGDPACAEFEMYTLSDYARLNEERREVLAAWGQPL